MTIEEANRHLEYLNAALGAHDVQNVQIGHHGDTQDLVLTFETDKGEFFAFRLPLDRFEALATLIAMIQRPAVKS